MRLELPRAAPSEYEVRRGGTRRQRPEAGWRGRTGCEALEASSLLGRRSFGITVIVGNVDFLQEVYYDGHCGGTHFLIRI